MIPRDLFVEEIIAYSPYATEKKIPTNPRNIACRFSAFLLSAVAEYWETGFFACCYNEGSISLLYTIFFQDKPRAHSIVGYFYTY